MSSEEKRKKNWGGESMLSMRRNGQEPLGVAENPFPTVFRLDTTANKVTFITLKDHQPSFCKISKTILDRINNKTTSIQIQQMEKHNICDQML